MDMSTAVETAEPSGPAKPKRQRWGPWATLGWAVPIALTLMISQILGLVLFQAWWNASHPQQHLDFPQLIINGGALAASLAVSTPFLLGLLFLIVRLSHVPISDYLALKPPRWRDLGRGVAAVAAVLFAAGIAANVWGFETPEFMTETFASARAAGLVPLLILAFVICAPLQEEMLFRGFFYRGLVSSLGVWPTIAITSLAWAVLHAQYAWFFVGEIFVLGIALGWLRARSGSTLLTLALHATINGLALVEMAVSAT